MTDQIKEATYWNGEPCPARKVKVVVGLSPKPTWWCADMVGETREAVEVKYVKETFYIDNEDGSGWHKVTSGRGSPRCYHASLPVASVVEEAKP